MTRKITVGPKIKQGNQVSVNVEYDDLHQPGSSSVHIKVVLPVVEGEADDGHIDRTADAVKRIVDRLSEEIASKAYAARPGLKCSDEEVGG